jgi:hypothetical protein
MKSYLSETPIWIKPTQDIHALDDKSVVVVQGGERTPAKIRVSGADPHGANAGLVSVAVWQASIDDAEWTDVGSPLRTSQTRTWQRFVGEDALALIRPNDSEWSSYGELLLEIPDAAKA